VTRRERLRLVKWYVSSYCSCEMTLQSWYSCAFSQDQQGLDLMGCTEEALTSAIKICGPGVPFREIGNIIQNLALLHGFSVSSEFIGHGIGRLFHQKPDIKHFSEYIRN
jgi:methionine aminopeptidase